MSYSNAQPREKLSKMEFLQGADNVYRTDMYIVKQMVSISVKDFSGFLMSEDTFYLRNAQRDSDYEFAFRFRKNKEGKRISSASYSRKYVD